MGQSSSKDAADIEGLRTVVFEKGGKSSLEPLDPEDAVPEGDAFPSNFVRVSKYSNYLVLVVSFTFLDFFRQVRSASNGADQADASAASARSQRGLAAP